MADDTIAFLDTVVGEPADLLGHSDGAFVAMLVAMQHPELVKRLVMISGGFNKSGAADPDPEWDVDQLFEFLGPSYGEVSPDGIDHFKAVASKVGEMVAVEPNLRASDLANVPHRTLVMSSDDDLMTLTHAVEMYDALLIVLRSSGRRTPSRPTRRSKRAGLRRSGTRGGNLDEPRSG
jgi:pimeloyl-ACP methyl ester carboxylesterase